MLEKVTNKTIYFKGLNSLRFFAAFAVLINHVEASNSKSGYVNIAHLDGVAWLGSNAVTFFFVLSGFLITYLLYSEQNRNSFISLKSFYLKRVLRIWPVYYIVLLIGVLVLPNFDFFQIEYNYGVIDELYSTNNVLLYSFFLANLAIVLYPILPIGHLWSIGVEEQFYLFWPILIRKSKGSLVPVIVIIIVFFLLRNGCNYFKLNPLFFTSKFYEKAGYFLDYTRIGSMGIGAVGAWLLFFHKEKLLNIVRNKILFSFILFLIVILLSTGYNIYAINSEFLSILFCFIIIAVSMSESKIFSWLENKKLSLLGKISYGIYMYHPIAMVISVSILRCLDIDNDFAGSLTSYFLILSITLLISFFSYQYIERPILAFKNRN